jgi:LacI family transcriptional regulator
MVYMVYSGSVRAPLATACRKDKPLPQGKITAIARQLLYQEVGKRITELIARQGLWGQHLAPERELAKLLGVGRQTLRRGLALLVKQGLLSRRHGHGTLVLPRSKPVRRDGRPRVLFGCNLEGGPGSYVGEVLAGLAMGTSEAGWMILHHDLARPAKRREFLHELAGGGIAGALLSTFTDRMMLDEMLRLWHGPMVTVDHYFENSPVTGVTDDSQDGARQAVEHLVALGHRRIAYLEIGQRRDNPWRYAGYAGALQAAGLGVDPSLVVPVAPFCDAARDTAVELLKGQDPPTAIFAFDDDRAWRAWRGAESLGLVVGRDVAVVGYGDSPERLDHPNELTSVRWDARAMGLAAVRALADQIAGRGWPGQHLKIPAQLMVRRSSREARPGQPGPSPRAKEGKN